LNQAYRKILHGAEFLALAKNRNFLDHDGELSLDADPFVAGLEYASGKVATVLGKPAPAFFKIAVGSMVSGAEDSAMIGDDAELTSAEPWRPASKAFSCKQENIGPGKR
jgi:ribonucleotide monophosphatase NagD (HAD superfamily)